MPGASSHFIPRNNEHEVLDELPSRTEVVLRVEADAEEARLQQALRKQALDRLRDDSEDENQRRFNVLAALMRLGRADCHPALVAPELGLPGSKLGQLLDLTEELRKGKHRALVFSQFTDFLTLVHQTLDARKVRYQYLDGQTPPKARQQAVDAFQRGEGDLFLLSLKAGRGPESDRRRLRDPSGFVVEPGHRTAGHRSRPPDRPDAASHGLQTGTGRQRRRTNPVAAWQQA